LVADDGSHATHAARWRFIGSIQPRKDDRRMTARKNEGEGNRTAARAYNKAQHDFATSGKVGPAAQDAAKAVDGAEAKSLKQAEQEGKRHSHGEDPALHKR
jgi:hypothetical protein